MNFTISNGQRLDCGTLPPSVVRVLGVLENLPDGLLLTSDDLRARVGLCRTSLQGAMKTQAMEGLFTRGAVKDAFGVRRAHTLFGNRATVEAYIAEFGEGVA